MFGQAIIILVYVPLLTFTGVEGKTFEPMALTVIIALVAAFVLSLTFVPAMIAIVDHGAACRRQENRLVRGLKTALSACAGGGDPHRRLPVIAAAVVLFAGAAAAVRAPRPGVHADARREEHRDGGQAHSEHVACAIAGACSSTSRRAISRLPQVAFVFSRTGTPDLAADPMPPNASDTYIIAEAAGRMARSGAAQGRLDPADRGRSIQAAGQQARVLAADPDALQRADRRRARGRGGQGLRRRVRRRCCARPTGSPPSCSGSTAPPTSRSSRSTGLPVLEIKIDKAEIARRGLEPVPTCRTSSASRSAGARPAWCSKATGASRSSCGCPMSCAATSRRSKNLPVSLPQAGPGVRDRDDPAAAGRYASILSEGPNQISRENGKRRVVVSANVRGRDIGSLVDGGAGQDRRAGDVAAGLLAGLGRAVRELGRGAATADDRRAAAASA